MGLGGGGCSFVIHIGTTLTAQPKVPSCYQQWLTTSVPAEGYRNKAKMQRDFPEVSLCLNQATAQEHHETDLYFFLFLFWIHQMINSFYVKCIRNNGLNLALKEVGIILSISMEVLQGQNCATWPNSLLLSLQMQAISLNLCKMRISKRILKGVSGFLSPCTWVLVDSCSPSL